MKSGFQLLTLVTITIGYTSCAVVNKLPPIFNQCYVGPQFDPCVERAIESALKELVKGYAPLGIFSVDPLEITALGIAQGSGPVSINMNFRDLLIRGLGTTKISNFKADLQNLKFSGKASISKVLLDGLYTINGKILILPITGDGKSKIVLDDFIANFMITGKHFMKDGVKYMKVEKFDFNFDTKKLSMNLSNLFKGDKALGDNMNRFLNENWEEILKELKPAVSETFGTALSEISNRIFNKVPFDAIFKK